MNLIVEKWYKLEISDYLRIWEEQVFRFGKYQFGT